MKLHRRENFKSRITFREVAVVHYLVPSVRSLATVAFGKT